MEGPGFLRFRLICYSRGFIRILKKLVSRFGWNRYATS